MDIGNIFNNIIEKILTNFYNSCVNVFSTWFADFSKIFIDFNNLDLVKNTLSYTQLLAITLLASKALIELFNTYVLWQNGDPDADPTGNLIRVAQAVAFIFCGPWLISTAYQFGVKVTTDILKLSSGIRTNIDIMNLASTFYSDALMLVLISLVILILILVVMFQIGFRSAEIVMLQVACPIFALNATTENKGIWGIFIRYTISITLTQSVQMFLLKCFFATASHIGTDVNGFTWTMLVISWLVVAIKSPKIIQMLIQSGSVGGGMGGAARQLGSMALSLIKKG